jgi:hypothetical protein
MPARITLRAGDCIEIGGVLVTPVTPENIVLAVATFDADGFMDSAPDLKTAARQWRRRFDKSDRPVDSEGNPRSVT